MSFESLLWLSKKLWTQSGCMFAIATVFKLCLCNSDMWLNRFLNRRTVLGRESVYVCTFLLPQTWAVTTVSQAAVWEEAPIRTEECTVFLHMLVHEYKLKCWKHIGMRTTQTFPLIACTYSVWLQVSLCVLLCMPVNCHMCCENSKLHADKTHVRPPATSHSDSQCWRKLSQ